MRKAFCLSLLSPLLLLAACEKPQPAKPPDAPAKSHHPTSQTPSTEQPTLSPARPAGPGPLAKNNEERLRELLHRPAPPAAQSSPSERTLPQAPRAETSIPQNADAIDLTPW